MKLLLTALFQDWPKRSSHSARRVFWLLFLTTLLFAVAVSVRLIVIGAFDYSHYSSLAEQNANETTPITAPRGIITDRFGTPLAENQPVSSAYLNVADMIKNSEQDQVFSAAENILGITSTQLTSEISSTN